jgi:hypothetical protein
MGDSTVNRKQQQIEAAEFKTLLAGTRAATFLGVLLKYNHIPEHHVAQAREIVKAHAAANTDWDSRIGDDDEPLQVGDRVTYNERLTRVLAGTVKPEVGTIRSIEGFGALAVVHWDSDRLSWGVHLSNLVRVA